MIDLSILSIENFRLMMKINGYKASYIYY